MMSKSDLRKNAAMPYGAYKKHGFMCWRYIFNGYHAKTYECKSFFIELLVMNPARSPQEPVFGQLYEQKGKKYFPSYIMIKAGLWGKDAKQIHEFYPVTDLKAESRRLNLQLNSLHISENKLFGSVFMSERDVRLHPEYMSDAGSMLWDLHVFKTLPTSFRGVNWYVQGAKTEYKGKIIYNDEEFIVKPEKSFGYADKIWGRDFTSSLMYASSCNLISDITRRPLLNSCFSVGCGCSKKPDPQTPPLYTAVFYYEGVRYEFGLSALRKKSRVKFTFREGADNLHWLICAETAKYLFDIDIYCRKTDTLFMHYESPEGYKYHNRLWSCGSASGEIKFFQKGGKKLELLESARAENCFCEHGEYDMMDFI